MIFTSTKRNMRIAMVGQKGIPTRFGGIERHVELLSVRLGKAGHEVLVYTRPWYSDTAFDCPEGVKAIVTPTIRTKHLDAIVHTFTSTLHAIRAGVDIIHFHGVGPSLLSWVPRLLAPGVRVVSTFHCIDRKHQKWGLFARLMLGLGERFACTFPHETITVSRGLRAYCEKNFGRCAHYIPNGIEEPAPGEQGWSDVLERYGLEPGGYIVMVSRLVRHKGAHHLIRAFRRIKRSGGAYGKKLVIVGDSAFTDDYVLELKQLAAGDEDIVFTGYQSGADLDLLFAGSYMVVHPSESEGLPISVLEAMSYGKTVLTSDIPENMEAVNEYGVTFRNTDVEDLALKMVHLIRHPHVVSERGAQAKRHVIRNYHWDGVADEVEGVYHSLVRVPIALKA
jgi:glycosyltransferase involved in cell wall biosynthesis